MLSIHKLFGVGLYYELDLVSTFLVAADSHPILLVDNRFRINFSNIADLLDS